MTKGEKITEELFKNRYSIKCIPIPVDPNKRTADFFLVKDDKKVAVCEVEDIEDVEPSEKTGFSRENQNDFWHRPDNTPGRVGKKIYEAYKQLAGYNLPKILVFVAFEGDVLDLENAINGFIDFRDKSGNVSRIQNACRVAFGKIKDLKEKIDLYIWIQCGYQDEGKIYFRSFPNDVAAKKVKSLFKI